MGLMSRRRFTRTRSGEYRVRLDPSERAMLASLPDQLERLLTGPSLGDDVARLFPTAYVDDASLDEEYQRLMRGELVRRRLSSVEVVRETLSSDVLTDEQLNAWIRVLNDIRLILGTLLDVSEDTDVLDVDPSAEDASQRVVYYVLSGIVGEAVDALMDGLPAGAD